MPPRQKGVENRDKLTLNLRFPLRAESFTGKCQLFECLRHKYIVTLATLAPIALVKGFQNKILMLRIWERKGKNAQAYSAR